MRKEAIKGIYCEERDHGGHPPQGKRPWRTSNKRKETTKDNPPCRNRAWWTSTTRNEGMVDIHYEGYGLL